MKPITKIILIFVGLMVIYLLSWIIFRATIAMIAMSTVGFGIGAIVWAITLVRNAIKKKPRPKIGLLLWWGGFFTVSILVIQLLMGIIMFYIAWIVGISVIVTGLSLAFYLMFRKPKADEPCV